ncbi:MAG: hypothetical protein SNJ57_06835, partial [Cyanobacteriota bacterium]
AQMGILLLSRAEMGQKKHPRVLPGNFRVGLGWETIVSAISSNDSSVLEKLWICPISTGFGLP